MTTWTLQGIMVELFKLIWKSFLFTTACYLPKQMAIMLSVIQQIKSQNSILPCCITPMNVTCTNSTVSAFIPFFLFLPIRSYWLNNAPNIMSSLQNFTIDIKILILDRLQIEEAKASKSNSEYWL